jgi:hypothetical protein
MDGFSGYNHIQIKPEDQHKTTFIIRVLLHTRRCLSALKMLEQPFNVPAFQDFKHIVKAYLDDLTAHSHKKADHVTHLQLVFKRCYYRIRLNPHKCILCVMSGRLLGFLVSQTGIMVDPRKVEAILWLSPRA